jgi:hypothetical protein
VNRKDVGAARMAFGAAVRIAPQSPGGIDAEKRLRDLR